MVLASTIDILSVLLMFDALDYEALSLESSSGTSNSEFPDILRIFYYETVLLNPIEMLDYT